MNLQLRNEYFQMRNTSMELFTDCKRLKESLDQHLVLLSEANEEIMKLNIEKMVCQKGLSKSL